MVRLAIGFQPHIIGATRNPPSAVIATLPDDTVLTGNIIGADATGELAEIVVVAGFPGGSDDFPTTPCPMESLFRKIIAATRAKPLRHYFSDHQ